MTFQMQNQRLWMDTKSQWTFLVDRLSDQLIQLLNSIIKGVWWPSLLKSKKGSVPHSGQAGKLALVQSEVAHEEVELLIEVGLEVKALHEALLDAVLLLWLQVHLVVVSHALVRASGHH